MPLPRLGTHVGDPAAPELLGLRTGGAGVVVGLDRYGAPFGVRLFRPEPTALVVVGTVRLAQLLAFRALAVGASVVVQSERPGVWSPFATLSSAPDEAVRLAPPGSRVEGEGTSQRPRLVVSDVGPATSDAEGDTARWTTTMTVRDELTAWDVGPLSRADVAVLQTLSPAEAGLAASVLNLRSRERALSTLRRDLVTVASHGTVRWAQVVLTPIEEQLIGPPARS